MAEAAPQQERGRGGALASGPNAPAVRWASYVQVAPMQERHIARQVVRA